MECIKADVAIIGGGPGGSTCGAFLKKYEPSLEVLIIEREQFPRDHVGESQLPMIGSILDEIGAWDKVEAAGFPIKVGATYRWGNTDDLWDFHFVRNGEFKDEPRPGRYKGQRVSTAFQVDRAVYDQILLDHAESLGCKVLMGQSVQDIPNDRDTVQELRLSDGRTVKAKTYIDASGHAGILRRKMGVGIEEPSSLRNIAIWDYWQNADWAVSVGVGGTRVQVMSLGYGWLWFIPLSATRTSIGLVCPADYYKASGLSPEAVYLRAIAEEPRISNLCVNATRENILSTTKDWSFVAERMTGPNWYLVGEALGFADPILAAGLTLTHTSAKECALSILEESKGADPVWLRRQYEDRNRRRVLQHIRFSDYWYVANDNFTALKEFTREIAKDAGLELDADKAFQWLGTGGFVEEDMGIGGLGSVDLLNLHQISRRLSVNPSTVAIEGYNVFLLKLTGAEESIRARYENGRVIPMRVLVRDNKVLPLAGLFGLIVSTLRDSPQADHLIRNIRNAYAQANLPYSQVTQEALFDCLEAMARDGWIKCKRTESIPGLSVGLTDGDSPSIATNRDPARSI